MRGRQTLRAAGGWLSRRAGWNAVRGQRRRAFAAARAALKPARIDWLRLLRSPEDGGRDRWLEMTQGTGEDELALAERRWRLHSLALLAGAVLAPAALVMFRSETTAYTAVRAVVVWGAALAIVLPLLAMAAASGYSAWQIRHRRTGSMGEWLRRLPGSLWS